MEEATELARPARRTTKQLTVFNNVLAWTAIGAAIWLGHEMASVIAPLMVVLIASLLGIYQGVGHFDLRAIAHMRDFHPGRRRARGHASAEPKSNGEGTPQ